MSASTLTAFNFIGEDSLATPGLFNRIFSTLSDNIAGVNSVVSSNQGLSTSSAVTLGGFIAAPIGVGIGTYPPSQQTTAGLHIGVNSSGSQYIYMTDSSGQRSSYAFGAHFGLADGLSLYDVSGDTMLANFSKQSIRFFQQVVGPVFDLNSDFVNAATQGVGTDSVESRINSAIVQAAQQSKTGVYLPRAMYPYSASSVSFIHTLQMVREGGEYTNYDVKAYGAYGTYVGSTGSGRDDTAAFTAAMAAVPTDGGLVYVPGGNYKITSTLSVKNGTVIQGAGTKVAYLWFAQANKVCLYIGENTGTLNEGNQVNNLGIILRDKTATAIKLRATKQALLSNLYLEGDPSQYTSRTNVGVDIDAADISAFFNVLSNVLCSHMNLGYYVHSTGATYATCQTFIGCSVIGDYPSDTSSKGYLFTRSPVATQYLGNGDGSVIVGGDVEGCSIGLEIEGGPITSVGLRIESCNTAVHFTSTSGRNNLECSRLTTYGVIQDDALSGAMNAVRESDSGGWRGTAKYSPSGDWSRAGSEVHEFHTARNSPVAVIKGHFGVGFTSDVMQVQCDTAAGTGFYLQTLAANGTDVCRIRGDGNLTNTNNSYGAISDAKIKQDVRPATSQLEDVKELARRMSKFRLKNDPDGREQIGWVAQDILPVSPGLVSINPDRDDNGEPTGEASLGIAYSVAHLKAFKALGELIERVDELSSEVSSLRANQGLSAT